jgi:hypothetical protein
VVMIVMGLQAWFRIEGCRFSKWRAVMIGDNGLCIFLVFLYPDSKLDSSKGIRMFAN